MPLFGAAFAAPKKAQQFHTDLDIYQQCQVLQKIEDSKDFSRHLSDFPVLFKKANSSTFQACANPVFVCWVIFACFFFLSHADFSKLTFSKNYFKNAIRLSNSFDPDQAQQTVCKGCQQMTLAGINLDSACPAVQRE